MLPLSRWPADQRRKITGVFTDIDDTLTTEGAITPDALAALGHLKSAGLQLIAITGRPVGWCEPFARSWPVDAIVAENGSVALVGSGPPKTASNGGLGPFDPSTGSGQTALGESAEGLKRLYQQDAASRVANFARMQQVARRVLQEVPGTMLSRDSPGRETDIAIDHSEFTQLRSEKIAQVVRVMQAEGMSATVSSIHINGWIGDHNKLQGAEWIVRVLLGRELAAERDRWLYVGDSTNDELMFEAFTHSVGVANIRRFASELRHWPRYVTQGERGAGFAEIAAALLSA